MNLVCVDPGQRGCGVAIFHREGLLAAAYLKNPVEKGDHAESWVSMAHSVCLWVWSTLQRTGSPTCNEFDLAIECPQVYPGPQQKGGIKGQNDLIALAAVVGTVVGRIGAQRVVRYLPRAWKGTLDPDVMTERIRSRLTAPELSRLEKCPKSLEHNLLDAVGIGLHAVGRLEPRRVIAR